VVHAFAGPVGVQGVDPVEWDGDEVDDCGVEVCLLGGEFEELALVS
jgi:hypothetical protein